MAKQILITLFITSFFFIVGCDSGDGNSQSQKIDSSDATPPAESRFDSFSDYVSIANSFSGDTTLQISKTLQFIDAFDSLSIDYDRDTVDIEEKTTEGGELIATQSPATRFVKLEGTLFGEMGKLGFKFYIYKAAQPLVSCVVYEDINYDRPLYQPGMKMLSPVTTYEIYSDNKLVAILDKQRNKRPATASLLDSLERDTKQFIKDYIDPAKLIH